MKRIVPLSALVLCLAAAVFAARPGHGGAKLHQIDASGITATVRIVEAGDGLEFSGTAQGLDPELAYVSLVYDAGSKPSGPTACTPTMAGGRTVLGGWTVAADGTGTFEATAAGLTLADIGTMSIRQAGALQACGKVNRRNVP